MLLGDCAYFKSGEVAIGSITPRFADSGSTSKLPCIPLSGLARHVRCECQSCYRYQDQVGLLEKCRTVVLGKGHIRLCLVEGLFQADFHPRQVLALVRGTPYVKPYRAPFWSGRSGDIALLVDLKHNQELSQPYDTRSLADDKWTNNGVGCYTCVRHELSKKASIAKVGKNDW